MTPKHQAYQSLATSIIKNLKTRNIEAFYCEDSATAVTLAMDLMKNGGTVGMGGTETVKETGLLDAVKDAKHLDFINRDVAKTPEEKKEIFYKTIQCDYFLMSTNAITGIYAAPPNAARLGTRTPCATLGHCGDCHSEDCMCCQIVVTRHSRYKGRIKVILIGEELGF